MGPKKIFITGGTGHLGANLIMRLLKKGYTVKVLFRNNSSHPFLKVRRFEKVTGDLQDKDSLMDALTGCDTVIHLGAFISYKRSDHKKLYNINVLGTKNLLRSAVKKNVKNFIYISSTAAVGYSRDAYNLLNEGHLFKKEYRKIGYMNTKHLAEQEVIRYKKQMHVSIFNPSTIIGKGDNHNNTGAVFENIKKERIRTAPPGGNSFVAVDDVVDAVMLALKKKTRSGERYILSGCNMPFKDYFNLIAKAYKVPEIRKSIPRSLFRLIYLLSILVEHLFTVFRKTPPVTSELIKISFAYRYFDSSKAQKELQWHSRTSINSALNDAIRYYKRVS
ncbi:MAG: NAD-dependent epimerase/dehydratase family protein [Spirochaetes bacterium]|nr:NAD-dependent epimerase/dehydratase family protein [Spirochaetota bacterium]